MTPEEKFDAAAESAKPRIEKEKEAALFTLEKARQAEHAENSYIGRIGKISAPLFAPLGIDWRGGVALRPGDGVIHSWLNRMILPDGETVVEVGDNLIVIAHHKNISAIAGLFKRRSFLTRS